MGLRDEGDDAEDQRALYVSCLSTMYIIRDMTMAQLLVP